MSGIRTLSCTLYIVFVRDLPPVQPPMNVMNGIIDVPARRNDANAAVANAVMSANHADQNQEQEEDQKLMELEPAQDDAVAVELQVDESSLLQQILDEPAAEPIAPQDDDQANDDDDFVAFEMNRESQESLGFQQNDDDELSLFCNKYKIPELLSVFRENGFDLVEVTVKMTRDDLMSIGCNLGQAMTARHAFEKYLGANESRIVAHCRGNTHYQRRIQRQRMNNQISNQNDINFEAITEEKINGRQRIIFNGPEPSAALKNKLKNKVVQVIMVDCDSTDCKVVRAMVDNNTKNGDVSDVRYYQDPITKTFPNSPIYLAVAGTQRLKEVGLITIEDEKYTERGYGGRPNWTGKIYRNKLSVAWDQGTPEQRENMFNYVKEHDLVRWDIYANKTNDELNLRALGLIGSVEPQFALTLREIVDANSNHE